MRQHRDVIRFASLLDDAKALQATYNAKSTLSDIGAIPEAVKKEREKYISREISFNELSLETRLWLSMESLGAKKKDPITFSQLPHLLERETWRPNDAMLILSGLDPDGIIMTWNYENFMGAKIDTPVIKHANWFTSTNDLYDYPTTDDYEVSPAELRRLIKEAKDCPPSRATAKSNIAELERRLAEVEKWEMDETSVFVKSMLGLRAAMTGILKARWESGDHDTEARRAPTFFINWAESRGFEVEWSTWAREQKYIDTAPPVTEPPFFDADAEDYPRLLHIAVRSWEQARKESHGTAKKRIIAFLNDRYPELSTSEKESIALICNWQKSGGRPKTGG